MLALKPPREFRAKLQQTFKRKGMTIAIGTYFADGVILCADTKFVDDNGNISYGKKIAALEAGHGKTFAIAHAANDSNAAAMLAGEILDALDASTGRFKSTIKQSMTHSQSDYTQSTVPFLQ